MARFIKTKKTKGIEVYDLSRFKFLIYKGKVKERHLGNIIFDEKEELYIVFFNPGYVITSIDENLIKALYYKIRKLNNKHFKGKVY
jgi:hypothetical protein